jgi:WD40 repeat protein
VVGAAAGLVLALLLDVDRRLHNLKRHAALAEVKRFVQRKFQEHEKAGDFAGCFNESDSGPGFQASQLQKRFQKEGLVPAKPSRQDAQTNRRALDLYLGEIAEKQREAAGAVDWAVSAALTPLYGALLGFALCGALGLACGWWKTRREAPVSRARVGLEGLIGATGGVYLGALAGGLGQATAGWLGGVPALAVVGAVWGLPIRWTLSRPGLRDAGTPPDEEGQCVRCGSGANLAEYAYWCGTGRGHKGAILGETTRSDLVCRACTTRQACRGFLASVALAFGILALTWLFFAYALRPVWAMRASPAATYRVVSGPGAGRVFTGATDKDILGIGGALFFVVLVVACCLAGVFAFAGLNHAGSTAAYRARERELRTAGYTLFGRRPPPQLAPSAPPRRALATWAWVVGGLAVLAGVLVLGVRRGGPVVLKGHMTRVLCVAWSPDGKRVVSGGNDRALKVWDAEKDGQALFTLEGHTAKVLCVAWSPDGDHIASGSEDGTLKIWDAETGREVRSLKEGLRDVYCVAWSPDGKRIACNGVGKPKPGDAQADPLGPDQNNQSVRILDAPTGRVVLSLEGHPGRVRCIAWSPDGKRLVAASYDYSGAGRGGVKVWDAASGREILSLQRPAGAVISAAFSPDGKRIVTGSEQEATVQVWDAATGKELLSFQAHSVWVSSVGYSPDSSSIVTAGGDPLDRGNPGELKTWDAATGRLLLSLEGHKQYVTSAAFNHDGQRIASSSHDKTVRVWNPGEQPPGEQP